MNIFRRNFSPKEQQILDNVKSPWAGLASYEDPKTSVNKLKFCGRDDESYDVAKLIMNNIFVTLYGKSGIGKTSLLNAGVFPELRKEKYTPISLRLGMRDKENPMSFQAIIVDAIGYAVKNTETINVIEGQEDDQAIDYLWNYFARHRFYDLNGEATIPVVVFDQFEEVFRADRNETEILLRQLDFINDKDHALDSSIVDGNLYRYVNNYRFVASIREDDLYCLEDSLDNCYLPALKRCRYRLHSLSEQGAREAILIPGEGIFVNEEKSDIANRIIDKSRNEDGSISTNLLSLLCNRIYVYSVHSGNERISLALMDRFLKGNPFERFYNEATRGLSNQEKNYIEDSLVDSTGRRNSIPENDFYMHVKNGSILLEGSRKLLQRTSTISDNSRYRIELIHDSFCAPLLRQKEKRMQRKRTRTLLGFIALGLFIFTAVWLYLGRLEKANEKMKENEILEAVSKSQYYLNQGDSYRARISLIDILDNCSEWNCPVSVEAALREATKRNTAVFTGHIDAVNYISYNKDGSLLVSGSYDNTIKLWNTFTGECVKTLTGHNDWIDKVEFGYDEKQLYSLSQDGELKVWDIETGEINKNYPKLEDVDDFYFSPDKQYVLLQRANAELYSVYPFKKIKTFINSENWDIIVWHPNGQMFYVYTIDDELCRVNVNSGETRIMLKEPEDEIMIKMTIDHYGQHIVLTKGNRRKKPGLIKVLDITTDKFDIVLKDKDFWPNGAAYSHDDKVLVTTSMNGTIRFWDPNLGTCMDILKGHTFGSCFPIFSPDGKRLATCSADNTIRIWDIRPEEDFASVIYHDKKSYIQEISFNQIGNRLVSLNDSVSIYDISAKKWIYTLPACPVSIKRAIYSRNDDILAIAYENDSLYLWNHAQKIWERKLRGKKLSINKMSLTDKFETMACFTNDSLFQVWDLRKEKLIKNSGKLSYACSAVKFSHNGRLLIQDCSDNYIRIWDTHMWTNIRSLKKNYDYKLISISNDDKYLIAVNHNILLLLDINTGDVVRKYEGHTSWIYGLAQSSDSRYFVTTSHDCMIKIWDFSSGVCLQSYLLEQLQAPVFNPRGNTICIGGKGKLLLIDFQNLKQLIDDTKKRFKYLR